MPIPGLLAVLQTVLLSSIGGYCAANVLDPVKPAQIFCELWQHPADDFAAGAAAALVTESDELLDPLPGIDFGRVQVAVGIDADLVEPMELTGFAPAPPEPS